MPPSLTSEKGGNGFGWKIVATGLIIGMAWGINFVPSNLGIVKFFVRNKHPGRGRAGGGLDIIDWIFFSLAYIYNNSFHLQ